jgi:hypothetical protein
MIDAPIGIDLQGYFNLVDEAILYLEGLSGRLAQSYDELYTQRVDVEDIGAAAEALIFAADRMKEQKIKLEEYRKELLRDHISELGEENR